jgi:hypothetical protein
MGEPSPSAVPKPDAASGGDSSREEAEARDRYRELLEELRTVIPGAQVLLAFLLAVPFTDTFTRLDDIGRDVFAGVLLGTALSTILFMTPAAYHRLQRRRDRAARLRFAISVTIVGMTLLTLSVGGAIFVVVRFIFGNTLLGVIFAATVMLTSAVLWYALPALGKD